MAEDPLSRFEDALGRDPRGSGLKVTRAIKNVYRSIGDKGPIEMVLVTHSSTSTEFLVGWTVEGSGRLEILRGGPARDMSIQFAEASRDRWTDEYRRYNERFLNSRAYPFMEHGTLDPDLEAPFYGIWAVEEASLHRPGHDDFGETRADKRDGYVSGTFASARVDEVVGRLVETIARLNRVVDADLPASLHEEQAAIDTWPVRIMTAEDAERRLQVAPEAHAILAQLDAKRLFAIFPRDARGRLKARQRVLLAPAAAGSERERRSWIVAVGPTRVGGPEITVKVEDLIAANQAERLDLAPWCWRKDSGELTDPATWGYAGDQGKAIALLRRGRVAEGLDAAGIQLDEGVRRLAMGSLIGLMYWDPLWPKVTRGRLCRLAPWLLLGPGLDHAAALLKRKSEGLRLFTLPGQSWLRKASVAFVPGREPSLEIRWTGANTQLPRVLWERPTIPGVWSDQLG